MIRPLRPGDHEPVAALVRDAFGAIAAALDPPPSGARVTAADVAAQEGGAVWDTGADGIGGCVLWRMRDDALYLNRVAVRPSLWGKGIARNLLAAAEAEGRRRGVPRLLLEVRLAMAANRRLFAAAGFTETVLRAHPGHAEPTFAEAEKRLAGAPGVRSSGDRPAP